MSLYTPEDLPSNIMPCSASKFITFVIRNEFVYFINSHVFAFRDGNWQMSNNESAETIVRSRCVIMVDVRCP